MDLVRGLTPHQNTRKKKHPDESSSEVKFIPNMAETNFPLRRNRPHPPIRGHEVIFAPDRRHLQALRRAGHARGGLLAPIFPQGDASHPLGFDPPKKWPWESLLEDKP